MAFFGVTNLGYQNPIGDKMIVNQRGASHPPEIVHNYQHFGGINSKAGPPPSHQEQQRPLRCTDTRSVCHQPLRYSVDIHHGSYERHKEMVKLIQTPSPDQLYMMPLTDNQQYGWMTSRSPEPWTQVKRFPRRYTEMTKFVQEMSLKVPEFSLF